MNQQTTQILQRLRDKKKFTVSDWASRGLNPSEPGKVKAMTDLLNQCLDDLLNHSNSNTNEASIRKVLKDGLSRFKANDFDTEEKEFVGDEFYKLGSIMGVNISNELNSWMYGKFLAMVLRLTRREEVVIDTRVVECSQCHLELKVKVLGVHEGSPNFWIIAKCVSCGEYSLLSTGGNTNKTKFENFEPVEMLDGTKTTEEQANNRLDQIRYFRK